MVFKRKEKEFPIQTKAYKFKIFPEHQKPDFDDEIKTGIFREARLMHDLWNRLVKIRQTTLETYSLIYTEESASVVTGDKKITAKELRKLSPDFKQRSEDLWDDYEQQIKTVAADADIRASVSWEIREDVLNRFEAAHKKALTSGAEIKLQPGFIQQFHFPHRFTGGGLDAGAIHSNRSKKIFVEAVPPEFYQNDKYQNRLKRVVSGRFGTGVGDTLQIPFRIVMHRQIPPDAKIKTAVLTGKFQSRVWEYFLVLTVDEPLPTLVERDFKTKEARAGLDLGWRKFEDYIRFGVLADSEGNLFEFRLPVNPPKKQSLRRLERLLAKHGKATTAFPQSWQDIEDWQNKNDLSIERVKEVLRELELPKTEIIKPIIDNLVKVRKSGLLRLLRALEDLAEPKGRDDDDMKATAILQNWRDGYFARENAINYARTRLINNRNYKYQLIAKWLKDNYAEIAYEGDLKLQEMAVKAAHASLLEENGAVLKNSAKYRGRVALHELLQWIKQKERKDEKWLHSKKSAYSTTTCHICGSPCQKTVNLYIICDNGHKEDQDVQAAINLRNELADDFTTSGRKIMIPVQLSDNIVSLKSE